MISPLDKKREAVLATLIHAAHPRDASRVLSHLLQEERSAIEAFSPQTEAAPMIEPLQQELERIHYSWLAEALRSKGASFQALVLKALPSKAASIAPLLHISSPVVGTPLSSPLENFFLLQLKQELRMAPVIPLSYLPAHPLNGLMRFSKRELVRLVCFLGLRDLAASLRKVVDRAKIASLKEKLSKAQQVYLENCLREQEIVSSPLMLAQWPSDPLKLAHMCEKRGLLRLGTALAHADRSLVWHLSHLLDVERGKVLSSAAISSVDLQMGHRYTYQIISLAKQLKVPK
jgi:hypothetical protein